MGWNIQKHNEEEIKKINNKMVNYEKIVLGALSESMEISISEIDKILAVLEFGEDENGTFFTKCDDFPEELADEIIDENYKRVSTIFFEYFYRHQKIAERDDLVTPSMFCMRCQTALEKIEKENKFPADNLVNEGQKYFLIHCLNNALQTFGKMKEHLKKEEKEILANQINEKSNATPQQHLKTEWDKKLENRVLKIYLFWNSQNETSGRRRNIFKNITQLDFLKMVRSADFSELPKTNILERLQYSIYALSYLLEDKDWGNRAAESIGKTLAECQKRSAFSEYEDLREEFFT